MGRKVAILGTAPGWEDAPFGDESWEIWGISRLYQFIPRWDVWFELHRPEEMCATWGNAEEATEASHRRVYHDWLRAQDKPIYVQEGVPQSMVPSQRVFPHVDVQRWAAQYCHYGPSDSQPDKEIYFTNTIAWLLAFALMQDDVSEVGIWGVDMALDSEYGDQRPSCEYFIGLGRGLGKRVHIPKRSDLLKTIEPYGFQFSNPFLHKMRAKEAELETKKRHLKRSLKEGRAALAALHGQGGLLDHLANEKQLKAEVVEEVRNTLRSDAEEVEKQINQGEHMLTAVEGNLDMLDYQKRNWFPHG